MMQENDVVEFPLAVRLNVAAVEHWAGEICYVLNSCGYKTSQTQAAAGNQAKGQQTDKSQYQQNAYCTQDIYLAIACSIFTVQSIFSIDDVWITCKFTSPVMKPTTCGSTLLQRCDAGVWKVSQAMQWVRPSTLLLQQLTGLTCIFVRKTIRNAFERR